MLYDGRRFHRKKTYVNEHSFWRCIAAKCTGNITLNSRNEIIKQKEHELDCRQDFRKNVFLKELDDLKKRRT